MALSIGDTVYYFDHNRRVYEKDVNGRSIGGPIYSEHFVEMEIIGQTSRSWVVGHKGSKFEHGKIPKNGGATRYYTEQERVEQTWVNDNRRKIVRAVEGADTDTLKTIAAIVGVA